jgi:hypothetical protein
MPASVGQEEVDVGKKEKKDKKKAKAGVCRKQGATSLMAIEALRLLGEEFPDTDRQVDNEMLVVTGYARNIGVAGGGDGPARHQVQIVLTGEPHPSMTATSAWLLFYEGDDGRRDPEYREVEQRILIHYPLSYLPAIESLLGGHKKQVWCQYREYEDGRKWADVHTWPIDIG